MTCIYWWPSYCCA